MIELYHICCQLKDRCHFCKGGVFAWLEKPTRCHSRLRGNDIETLDQLFLGNTEVHRVFDFTALISPINNTDLIIPGIIKGNTPP